MSGPPPASVAPPDAGRRVPLEFRPDFADRADWAPGTPFAVPASMAVLQALDAPVGAEERFRALAQAAWEGICFSDGDTILDVNPQLAAMLGYAPQELIGRSMLRWVAPDSHSQVMQRVRTGSLARHEYQAVRKDGGVITVEARGQIVSYGGRPVRVTAIRDISERVRTAERRRAVVAGTAGVAGESFFHSLVKHLARALSARYAFVGELHGDEMRSLSIWCGDDYGRPLTFEVAGTPSAEVIANGLSCYPERVAERFPGDWTLKALNVSGYAGIPLCDPAGNVLGVLGVAHDGPLQVDEELGATLSIFASRAAVEIQRIRMDADVRRLNEELELRVAQRTQDLRSANHELEAFCYSVSHDLRAPLRQIAGFADLLNKSDAALPETDRQHLADIRGCADKMSKLIDTLLQFSKVGRVELTRQDVALAPLVDGVRAELMREVKGRQVEWTIGHLPEVIGDPALLRQALYNLLANALKYTRPRERASIEIGMLPSENVCFVRDNGVGFDMRAAHRLFGVFQRLHPASSFEGTGIGLANVQRIIHRHGGRVWAIGEVDCGATFYFSLPTRVAL